MGSGAREGRGGHEPLWPTPHADVARLPLGDQGHALQPPDHKCHQVGRHGRCDCVGVAREALIHMFSANGILGSVEKRDRASRRDECKVELGLHVGLVEAGEGSARTVRLKLRRAQGFDSSIIRCTSAQSPLLSSSLQCPSREVQYNDRKVTSAIPAFTVTRK